MKPLFQTLFIFGLTLIGSTNGLDAAEPKPNIVVILADDLGWGSVGCYGDTRLQTPNIDRLAREGRLFRHAYATGSVCSPTRYALMTGRYYWRTSMKDGLVLPGNGPLHMETNRTTLASVAKAKGYQTAVIGKWHLGLGDKPKVDWNAPLAPGPKAIGFDYFYGLAANYGNPPNLYVENERLLGVAPGEKIVVGSDGDGQGALQDPRVADEVMNKLTGKCVEWIGKNKSQPFFCITLPLRCMNRSHHPRNLPDLRLVSMATLFTNSIGPWEKS